MNMRHGAHSSICSGTRSRISAVVAVLATTSLLVLANSGVVPSVLAASAHDSATGVATTTIHEIGKTTLPETSTDGPAFATAYVPNGGGSESVIAWVGTDAAHHLNIETSTNGLSYSHKAILIETSPYRPDVALETAGGPIAMAWAGTDAHSTLNVVYDVYGKYQKLTLWGETSLAAPAITLGPGPNIFLAFTDPNHTLEVQPISITSSGLVAGARTVLSSYTSDTGPHLARRGANTLVLAWTAPTLQLALATSQDGIHWSTTGALPQFSLYAPDTNSLEPYIGASNREWIGWTGTDAGRHLNLQYTTSFPSFPNPASTKTTLDEMALNGPALGYNGGLQMAWTGTDAAHHLNVATFAYS